jgi:glucose-6-phosphate 1-dehydrogenase
MHNTFSIEVIPEPCVIVIFGATGDLSRRKIMPSICTLFTNHLLHKSSTIIACGRSEHTAQSFRESIAPHIPDCVRQRDKNCFLNKISYIRADANDPLSFKNLAEHLKEMDGSDFPLNHLYYLAIPPSSFKATVEAMHQAKLMHATDGGGWRHLVIEKPFGEDLASSLDLDNFLHERIDEHQIFRIDHYLAKETVQNILITRFANRIFETIWDRRAIDHISIKTSETVGLEGRTAYFDKSGLLRDMFQNHLMEILMLIAMEPPQSFEASAIHKAKLELINAIMPYNPDSIATHIIRAQYTAGNGLPGYREEEGIAADSMTESFVRMKMLIDNERWQGVPFYIQAGKRMATLDSEIAVVFKHSPYSIFSERLSKTLMPNTLVLRIRPDEGVQLTLQAKHSGPKLAIGNLHCDAVYEEQSDNPSAPDAYARLLLDAMLHDHTLFVRSETIIESWRLFTPILQAWREHPDRYPLHFYPAGSNGPEEALYL